MKITLSELQRVANKALANYGYSESESKIILDLLMYAQLRGNNQGIVKLIGRGLPKHEQAKPPTIEKEGPTTAIINANLTMEAIVMEQAVAMAVEKAKTMGIAIVGTHNGSGSSGAIGYWSRKVADAGLIGITMSSYPFGSVPPHGSYEPLFCTNPIAWGIPTQGEPIVLDMASAAIAYYGLVEAKTEGKKLSKKLGYDSKGNETDDPEAIMGGATKPFDFGYKGAGLAMMVQILAGALVGADFLNGSDNDGNVIIAINPEAMIGNERFFSEIKKMSEAVKNAKKLPGVTELYLPGERGDAKKKAIETEGEIEIEANLLAELQKFAE